MDFPDPPTHSTGMVARNLMIVVSFAAVVCAFLAGFRAVLDLDFCWQMATGGWAVMHHRISSDVILSYTALGNLGFIQSVPGSSSMRPF